MPACHQGSDAPALLLSRNGSDADAGYQPIRSTRFMASQITPEGALSNPQQSRSFALGQPSFIPPIMGFFKSDLPYLLQQFRPVHFYPCYVLS
jgi:hypothetical protein